MSVRVNLLPETERQRGEANRMRIVAGVLGLLLIVGLAVLTFLQRSDIDDAQQQLAEIEQQNQALQADITALQPFADLEARAATSVDLIGAALGDEASLATVLQDLSAVLPPNAQLDTVALTFGEEPEAPAAGGGRLIYGRLAATGQVLEGLAPGVERLIIDLDRVAAFDNAYVTTSTVDENGVATFTLDIELGPEILTERYGVVVEPAAGAAVPEDGSATDGESAP